MPSGEGADITTATANEPLFQGRSIRSWVESLSDGDDAACRRAGEALERTGMELATALTALAAVLQRQMGPPRARAGVELGRLGVRLQAVIPRFRAALRTAVLTDSDETVRTSALQALTLLGPTST